ncbi:Tetraspanin [Lamellibrachia satsuma]|nr:Tetraspanin [Lamellibrachia satsuma]
MPASVRKSGSIRVKGKDDGCCGVFFLKYVLYVFNIILWLSGLLILAMGLWTVLDKHHYVSLLSSNTYVATTYLLIATGGFILIVGIFGCCGAWKENRICLMAFASFLFVIFLLEAISGVLAYMYEATVHDELMRSLNSTLLNTYEVDRAKTQAIDNMQTTFQCCGAESFKDWRYRPHTIIMAAHNYSTPDSCCKSVSEGCAIHVHPSNIYYDGCITKLEHYLKEHLIIIGSVGLGICCLQIFGILFACCLAKSIKEWEDRQSSYSW